MANASMLDHFEPIHAAMADTDAVDVRRLGDDHKVGPIFVDESAPRQTGNPRKATAFLVHRAALLDGSMQSNASAPDRLNRENRRRDPGLLVARAATVEFAAADQGTERVDGPTRANWHDVEVPVEVQDGNRAFDLPHDVDARVLGGVFRPIVRSHVLDVVAEDLELPTNEFGCCGIFGAWGIDGRDACEPLQELDHLTR